MNASLRAAVIAEWRGLPQRKLQADRWQSPSELMPRLMQRLGLRERLRETEVIDAWSKIVGDFIAAHSTPVALREGVLYVRVLQPALHYELEQISKSEILRKLKQRFGGKTIRDVRFRVGCWCSAGQSCRSLTCAALAARTASLRQLPERACVLRRT